MDSKYIEIEDPIKEIDPTEEDIKSYAEWLGADPENDRDLFWIAEEALKAPIPNDWKIYQVADRSSEPFYFNTKTGQSLWDHPLDSYYKELFANEHQKKYQVPKNTRPSASLGMPKNTIEQTDSQEISISPKPLSNDSKGKNPEKSKKGQKISRKKEDEEETKQIMGQLNEIRLHFEREKSTLQSEVNELTETKINIQKEISLLQEEKRNLQSQIGIKKASMEKEIDDEKKRIQDIIESVKKQGLVDIEKEKSSHMQNLADIRESNKKQISDEEAKSQFSESCSKEIELMRSRFESDKSSLENQYKLELENVMKRKQKEIEEIKRIHQEHIDQEKKAFALENRVELLKEAYNRKKKEFEIRFQNDISEMKEKQLKQVIGEDNKNNELIEKQKAEIDTLKSQLEEISEIKADYEIQKKKIKKEYEDQIKTIQSFNQKEMLKIEQEMKNKMIQQKNMIRIDVLEDIKTDFIEKKRVLEDEQKAEIESMVKKHNRLISRMKKEQNQVFEIKKEELNDRYQGIIEDLENEYNDQIALIKKKNNLGIKKQTIEIENSNKSKLPKRMAYKFFVPINFPPGKPSLSISKVYIFCSSNQAKLSVVTKPLISIQPCDSQQQNDYMTIVTDFPESSKKLKFFKEYEKCDQNTGVLNENIKSNNRSILNIVKTHKDVINDHNRTITQISLDMQKNRSEINKNLEASLVEIDSTFREVLSHYSSLLR